jgi:hypothetical protein
MFSDMLRKNGGWAALAAGGISLTAAIALMLFFTVEAPQSAGSSYRFGFLSDVLPILAAIPMSVVIAVFYRAQRKVAQPVSMAAALMGMAGSLFLAAVYVLFVFNRITFEEQFLGYMISMAPLGLWYLLVCTLAQYHGSLPARLLRSGSLLGVSQLLTFVIFIALGGYNAMAASTPEAILANPPLAIFLGAGFLMGSLGYFGPPVWLIWLGRALLRQISLNETGSYRVPAQGSLER